MRITVRRLFVLVEGQKPLFASFLVESPTRVNFVQIYLLCSLVVTLMECAHSLDQCI